MSWAERIDWTTTAGRTLHKLIEALPADRQWSLTLFGSSPLQLVLEPTFTSLDLDLFAGDGGKGHDEIAAAIQRAGLSREQRDENYVQLCVESNFRTSPLWKDRAFRTQLGHVRLTLPHPIDLLIAKLHRLADKDLLAFRLVIERTGHPTEDELRRELQTAVDLFRPNFDEEMIGDITTNTRVLWQELWGKDINVRQEIIAPALRARREGYEPDIPRRAFGAELDELSKQMTPTAPSFLDPAALMSIRNLELRARTVVDGFWHGIHRSPYHGFSVEFTEYRPYVQGDDLRYLDWRLVARTDRYFIKKFEDETNLRCHLLVDNSRSMTFGSRAYTKADYARTLAATLAYFLAQQGDATGLVTFDESVREYLPARNRPGHLRHLMLALEKPAAGRATDLAAPLRRVSELIRKRGLIVLISDLLAPVETLESALALLTAARHEVVIFQVLDPAELAFDFAHASRFLDVESGRDLYLDPALARGEYTRRLEAHLSGIRATCQRLGISHVQLSTAQPLELALFDFLKSRADRGKRIVRRKGAA